MPPSEHRADDPDAWIAMAREDLALAEAKPAGVSYRPLCFHAQQAAEKATKAVLIAKSVLFPYIHDIGRLLELARSSGLDVPHELKDADLLTDYVSVARYPGFTEIIQSDYEMALALARRVLQWAEAVPNEHTGG